MHDPARIFVLGSFVNACCAEVDRLPRPGETLQAVRFTSEPGGKGFNVAAGARRLGASVECLVAVGDDAFGRMAETAFTTVALPIDLIRRYPTATGAGVGFIQASGENVIAVCPGANLCLCEEDVQAAVPQIEAAAITTAQFEVADLPIRAAFAIARQAGRMTLLNPSPFRPPPEDILAMTTVLVVNEREAADLARMVGLGAAPVDALTATRLAEKMHEMGPEILVITLGARGAMAIANGQPPVAQPAFVVAAIDTLGAGDAFVAALAVGLAEERTLAEAVRQGAAAGAVMASRSGTFAALPSRDDLDHLLQDQPLDS